MFLSWDIITPKNRYVQIFLIEIIFWAQLPNFPPSEFPWKFRAKYEYMENINIGSTKNVKDVYLCMVRLQWVFMFSVRLHKDVSFKIYKFKNFYSSLIFWLHSSNCYLCNLFLFQHSLDKFFYIISFILRMYYVIISIHFKYYIAKCMKHNNYVKAKLINPNRLEIIILHFLFLICFSKKI